MGILQSVIRSITDKEDVGRPQSPLFPQANHSISSSRSGRYYLYTGENFDQYTPRTNNSVASSHQWQNGTRPLSGGKEEQKERVKERMMFNSIVVSAPPPQERWIKHYSSGHRILLVGEGDFSFSNCLAATFGSASNMIATSLDSRGFLARNYQKALSNIMELTMRKCKVVHEVDATAMANHDCLGGMKFDRIIFNFPYAGFFKTLSRDDQLRLHRTLLSLFLKNAKEMLRGNGQIHITHKTNGFHKEWYVESIASSHKLRLIEAVQFCKDDYPGYNTKYGFGGDNNFDCNPAKTYKFELALFSY
ncbi:hypothetical protein CDL12_08012 [Handroanthus impetiginosus]|uniref:25S rRNA (uridine-N(3))-methyltransferase BMT5-like domain-containing protein n=1 Tax=Handroanthus impetiginosus TaxID=429701 RepID=A0A2G9HPU3_9LAMI|nr:hypothetical protein CDL12_08012 [Handroanthus impetiginosus]